MPKAKLVRKSKTKPRKVVGKGKLVKKSASKMKRRGSAYV